MNAEQALELAESFKDLNDFQIAEKLIHIWYEAQNKAVETFSEELRS